MRKIGVDYRHFKELFELAKIHKELQVTAQKICYAASKSIILFVIMFVFCILVAVQILYHGFIV